MDRIRVSDNVRRALESINGPVLCLHVEPGRATWSTMMHEPNGAILQQPVRNIRAASSQLGPSETVSNTPMDSDQRRDCDR